MELTFFKVRMEDIGGSHKHSKFSSLSNEVGEKITCYPHSWGNPITQIKNKPNKLAQAQQTLGELLSVSCGAGAVE